MDFGHVLGGDGVIGDDGGSALFELVDDFEGLGVADVVGVGFEGEPEEGDAFVLEGSESFGEAIGEVSSLFVVDLVGGGKEVELVAEGLSGPDESGDVFGEAASSPSESGVEEIGADSFIEAHSFCDLGDVGSALFADAADGVDKADFCGEEGVGGVLDEFGGGSVRDEDGAAIASVEPHEFDFCAGSVDSDDDSVGVDGVVDGGAFAEELGVADDVDELGVDSELVEGLFDEVSGADGDG